MHRIDEPDNPIWLLLALTAGLIAMLVCTGCEPAGEGDKHETIITAQDGSTVILVSGQGNTATDDKDSTTTPAAPRIIGAFRLVADDAGKDTEEAGDE